VVSDRYQNYFHPRWEHIAGNQACLSHLLRDYEDCAESYPGAVWPMQAQRALRGLIRAWHAAREQGLDAIPAGVREPLEHEFRHAVLAGLASVPRVPGPKNSTKQKPGRDLLEFCRDRRSDVLLFTEDTSVWPTNDRASHCTSWGRCAVFAWVRWLGWLADVILALGSDIFAGSRAAGDAVGVAAP
jgi:transposase